MKDFNDFFLHIKKYIKPINFFTDRFMGDNYEIYYNDIENLDTYLICHILLNEEIIKSSSQNEKNEYIDNYLKNNNIENYIPYFSIDEIINEKRTDDFSFKNLKINICHKCNSNKKIKYLDSFNNEFFCLHNNNIKLDKIVNYFSDFSYKLNDLVFNKFMINAAGVVEVFDTYKLVCPSCFEIYDFDDFNELDNINHPFIWICEDCKKKPNWINMIQYIKIKNQIFD